MAVVSSNTCSYCYLDIDIDGHRSKLATAAAFVDATDSRYGFSSKNLLSLGGSEVSRIPELIEMDHEWNARNQNCGGIVTKAATCGNRIILRLFWDVAPLACENFATLCGNGSLFPGQSGKPKPPPMGQCGKMLSYRNSNFHRVVPHFVMQGGDFVFENGSGGESIFGKKFKDERAGLQQKHDRKGLLSMGNSGKNANSSQFFITFAPTPQCDGKHVVFGEVVSGFDILDTVEKYGTAEGRPTAPISITDCGIFEPLKDIPPSGYWYDKPDFESFSGVSSVFVVRPRVVVIAPSEAVLQKCTNGMGTYVTIVSRKIVNDTAMNTNDTCQETIDLLLQHAADVVIIAPSCWKALQRDSLCLPESWQDEGISKEEVFLIAKPIEALEKVLKESWIVKQRPHWQLDGSF